MKKSKIHVSKKLEKLIKSMITVDQNSKDGKLGKWNATLFHMDRQKCWLITNAATKYSIILVDIKAKDLLDIDSLFKDELYNQLVYDGIIIDLKNFDELIGKLEFHPTDNDRNITGFHNHRLQELKWWKERYGHIDNMPMRDLIYRINNAPTHKGKGYKMSEYTVPLETMRKLLSEIF